MKCINNFMVRMIFLIVFVVAVPVLGWGNNLTLTQVGGSGTRTYEDLCIYGDYAFCTALEDGVDIFNVSNTLNPIKIGHIETPGSAHGVAVSGQFLYVADDSSGLQVYNISNIAAPLWVGNLPVSGNARAKDIIIKGNLAYLLATYQGMMIVDISNPAEPAVLGTFQTSKYSDDIILYENYVYMAIYDYENYEHEAFLYVIDVSNPRSPQKVAHYNTIGRFYGLQISGRYLFCTYYHYDPYSSYVEYSDLLVMDLAEPDDPEKMKLLPLANLVRSIVLSSDGNYAYISFKNNALSVVDISNPVSPNEIAYFQDKKAGKMAISGQSLFTTTPTSGFNIYSISTPSNPELSAQVACSKLTEATTVKVRGNYAYVLELYNYYMMIFDISTPSNPVQISTIKVGSEYSPANPFDIDLKGDYAYIAGGDNGLLVMDISNPAQPVSVSNLELEGMALGIHVNDNYAYIAGGDAGIHIVDISNPSSPVLLGSWKNNDIYARNVHVKESILYVADLANGLFALNVANPANPVGVFHDTTPKNPYHIVLKNNYLFIDDVGVGAFHIYDIANPASPALLKSMPVYQMNNLDVSGDQLFALSSTSLSIYDISNPTQAPNFEVMGKYHFDQHSEGIHLANQLVYVASKKLLILQYSEASSSPKLKIDRDEMTFKCQYSGHIVPSQSFSIINSGGGNLDWSLSSNADWLRFQPREGSDEGIAFVMVDSLNLGAGTYNGKITVESSVGANSPQEIEVTLQVDSGSPTPVNAPFGSFDTPLPGASVMSSIPVTGWALDNTGVKSVQIFRKDETSMAYIGDAVFIEGARPDVAGLYPSYPNSTRAGWGYMLLTNLLPGGDGQYTLYAIATDDEGNQTQLGSKTITVDNAHAVKPFGAIDTPGQGSVIDGDRFVQFGWALTPQPNMIPVDGSTITVWVDGVPVGHPVYNQYRSDIATLFPDYQNSQGAVGYFIMDTTQYENGLHTIQWSVKDDAGNSDGIGSRYFTITNESGDNKRIGSFSGLSHNMSVNTKAGKNFPGLSAETTPGRDSELEINVQEPVLLKKGFSENTETLYPNENGVCQITIPEAERIEIHFQGVTEIIGTLPIGSSLNREEGVFYWQPGAGVLGSHHLQFKIIDDNGLKWKKELVITFNLGNELK